MEPSATEFVRASASSGNLTTAGAAIKAFVLTNPAALAGVAGIIIGILGYRLLHHEHTPDGEDEAAEAPAS